MSAIKQIQCPACGANSTFKHPDGTYRCNYCQSNFELSDNLKQQKKKELQDQLQNSRNQTREDLLKTIKEMQPTVASAGKKLGCIITAITLTFIAGIGSFVFFSINKSIKDSGIDIFSDWSAPSLSIYQSFVGSKGPVIWEISSRTRNKLDSAKYSIEIIDPETKTVLIKKTIFETMTWTESFNFGKKLDGRFFQMGDIAYNCSEENGLIGFDIYSFDVVVNEETLGKKYPELLSGISKASFMWYKVAFDITTNKGKQFVYYPKTNLLRPKHKDDNSFQSDAIIATKIYLSDQKQAQLYLITRKQDNTRDELNVPENMATQYEKNNNFFKNTQNISSMQKLSERVFFKSEPLFRHNGSMVFLYVDDLSKKAKVHLECVDTEGKTVWINSDAILEGLKSNNNERLSFEYRHNDKFLTISLWGAKRKTHCFDLKNGKLLWSYSPKK